MQREIVNSDGLRLDGRRVNEIRNIQINLTYHQKFNGSALFEIGNTKVLAYVDGPKEVEQRYKLDKSSNKAIFNCDFFITNFTTGIHKDKPKQEMKKRDYAKIMKDSFKSVIILDSYPRSQIDLHICVLENDGSYLSASFNAATLALIDAGIRMKDMIVSCCSGLFSEESILDLLSEEEKQESIANIILAYQHMHKSISFIHTSNTKINSKSLQILLECCIEGCKRIHKIMKQNIKKHIKLSKIL